MFAQQRGAQRKVVIELSHFMSLLPVIANTDLIATVPRDLAFVCRRYADVRIVESPIKSPAIAVHQAPARAQGRGECVAARCGAIAVRVGGEVTRHLIGAQADYLQCLRVATGGTRRRLMPWRSSLRSDCTPVLGPRSRRRTHFVRCARYVQTNVGASVHEARCARRPRTSAPRRHRNRRRRVPPAAQARGWPFVNATPPQRGAPDCPGGTLPRLPTHGVARRHMQRCYTPGRFIWHEVGCELMYASHASSGRKP